MKGSHWRSCCLWPQNEKHFYNIWRGHLILRASLGNENHIKEQTHSLVPWFDFVLCCHRLLCLCSASLFLWCSYMRWIQIGDFWDRGAVGHFTASDRAGCGEFGDQVSWLLCEMVRLIVLFGNTAAGKGPLPYSQFCFHVTRLSFETCFHLTSCPSSLSTFLPSFAA